MLTYDMEDRGGTPLYEYLYRCIREDIRSGALPPGEKLPSKRALAEHLRVSVITVESAYAQLEAEGYVRSIPGKGSFASPHTGVDEARRQELFHAFDQAAAELLFLGMTAGELAGRLEAAARQTVREERSYD